ncbi:MAG: hypothetical protein Q4D98_11220 [Planctomycetia bacterium]|nr:hypothetical protein [Planctomycetia bacterium]
MSESSPKNSKNYNAILETLYRMHRQFADLFGRLRRGPKKIAAAEERVAEFQKLCDEAVKRVIALRVVTDDKQARLEAAERNIERRHNQMMEAKNNTEYQGLKEQIAADKAACGVLEDEILESLDRIEEYKVEADRAKQDLKFAKSQLEKITAEVAEEKASLEGEIQRIKEDFRAEERKLDGEHTETYKRLFKTHQFDTLVPVDGMICQGCYTKITMEQIATLYGQRVVLCTACGRMLFLPEGHHL